MGNYTVYSAARMLQFASQVVEEITQQSNPTPLPRESTLQMTFTASKKNHFRHFYRIKTRNLTPYGRIPTGVAYFMEMYAVQPKFSAVHLF